jgi:hypothetical protein
MFRIRMQKLFVVTVVLKLGTAFLGWRFSMPWSLGFAVPLAIMCVYIAAGLRRADDDVSDEKFADTCYYLGFIFTITSIIFSLFDLPQIGTRIQDIAVRFGAAMVSTVLGLAVRVFLVSFRKDGADAVQDAEDAVVEAAQRFREQLVIAVEKLQDFEQVVDRAAVSSVERVNLQVEKLSSDYSLRLQGFFTELAQQNQVAFTSALEEVKTASLRLSGSFDSYSVGIQKNLSSIEGKVTQFADAVSGRLATTTFPDDFFASRLQKPIAQLEEASQSVAKQVLGASEQVAQSTVVLTAALRKLKLKAEAAESSLETVQALAATQRAVTDTAQEQLIALQGVQTTLARFDQTFTSAVEALRSNIDAGDALKDKVQALLTEEESVRADVSAAVKQIAAFVQETRASTEVLGARLEKSVQATAGAADQVGLAAVAVSRVPAQLEALAAGTGTKIDSAVSRFDAAADHLRGMTRSLEKIETRLVAAATEEKQVTPIVSPVVTPIAASSNLTAGLTAGVLPILPVRTSESPTVTSPNPVSPISTTPGIGPNSGV